MKDDMQTTNMYAKRTGIAGDTLRQSHGAEKIRNKAEGKTINKPVMMFIGLSRVFCKRPPKQNTVFPEKYW
jgi:hypothetical protein